MKFNLSNKLNTALSLIGVPNSSSRPVFPGVIDQDYVDVWSHYLSSRTVSDILRKYESKLGLYYVSMGFISFLEGLHSSEDKNRVDSSFNFYDVKHEYVRLDGWLHNKLNVSKLKLNSHKFNLSYDSLPVINAITNIRCIGMLEYKMQGRLNLDNHLRSLKLFRYFPEVLEKKKNYPRKEKLAMTDSNEYWYEVNSAIPGLKIKLARTLFNTLLVKYSFSTDIILFKGSMSDSHIIRTLNTRHKHNIILN